MLAAIRSRSAGIIVKGLLTLLILSFALWGVADVVSPGGDANAVATVGGVAIDDSVVRQQYRREIERVSGIIGKKLDPEQARAFGIPENVLTAIIDRTLYDMAATDLGIVIGDQLVRENINTMAVFKNKKGEFESSLFQQVLMNNGLSEDTFVNQVRNGLRRSQFLSLLGRTGVAPTTMAEALYRFRGEERIAETVSIRLSAIKVPDKPGQADLEAFHKDNAARYTAPQYRKLTIVRLQASELAKEIVVSDEELARTFEGRSDEFTEPERRVLQQIRVADEATAKKAHQRLGSGDDFATVAKQLASMDAKATELGRMTHAQLPKELADAAFALNVGAISQPVKSLLGWHILKLTAIEEETVKTLDQAKDALTKDIATEKAIDSLYQMANTLEDQLGGGAGLEEAARALAITPTTVAIVDAAGRDDDGKKVKGLPGSDFLTVAFTTPEGTESQMGEDGDDGYYVVRVDSVTPPALRPLGKVVDRVARAWTESRRAAIAKQTADEILEKLKTGGDLFKLASSKGLKVTTSAPFTRAENVSGMSAEMVNTMFKAAPGDAVSAPTNTAHMVGRLKQVNAAKPASKKDMDSIAKELGTAMQSDLLIQLAEGLRRRYPVTVNSKALNELF